MALSLKVFLFFVSSTLALHVMAWLLRQQISASCPNFWSKIDYVIYLLAVVGLISATADADKLLAKWEYSYLKGAGTVFNDTDLALLYVKRDLRYYDTLLVYDEWEHDREQIPIYMAMAQWLKELEGSLKKGYEDDAWEAFLDQRFQIRPDLPDDSLPRSLREDKDYLLNLLQDMAHKKRRLADLSDRMQTGGLRPELVIFAPWLIAASLALRLTKVTVRRKHWDTYL